MITISLSLETVYYVVSIINFIIVTYKLGYENGKNAKNNCPKP